MVTFSSDATWGKVPMHLYAARRALAERSKQFHAGYTWENGPLVGLSDVHMIVNRGHVESFHAGAELLYVAAKRNGEAVNKTIWVPLHAYADFRACAAILNRLLDDPATFATEPPFVFLDWPTVVDDLRARVKELLAERQEAGRLLRTCLEPGYMYWSAEADEQPTSFLAFVASHVACHKGMDETLKAYKKQATSV